ncbi:MAG: hypothetical protein SFU25_02370 [Candidatus Caenarcaniphilales bacterium]|nr:hypothetical protein [Candidatus Caenarcaniphilales bacterium]
MKILNSNSHRHAFKLYSAVTTSSNTSPATASVDDLIAQLAPSENTKNSKERQSKAELKYPDANPNREPDFQNEFLTDPKPIVERWICTVKEYWWALGIGALAALTYAITSAKIYRYKMGEAEKAHQEEKAEIKDKVSKLMKNGKFSTKDLEEAFSTGSSDLDWRDDEKIKRKLIKEVLEEERTKYGLDDSLITAISTRSTTQSHLNLDSFDHEDYQSYAEYGKAIKEHIKLMLPNKINNLKYYANL